MTHVDKRISKIGNHTFSATVKFRWDRFVQWCNLRDTHRKALREVQRLESPADPGVEFLRAKTHCTALARRSVSYSSFMSSLRWCVAGRHVAYTGCFMCHDGLMQWTFSYRD